MHDLGITLIAADDPDAFTGDTPTQVLIRQILGAVSQFQKAVIDGLLYHEADLSILTHHTDGGGVSDHNFALAYLIGFYFAPRIPSLAERRLYTLGPTGAWPALAPFIGGRADEKLITAHWNDALRFATSVRTGAASASLLLKRLGAYPRQNGLALALREIGRIERTLFMLDWLELPGLRRRTTAELNKGEARNALVRAVCFHRLGRLRDRTIEAQQYRASGLALVTAAIALWNTVYLGHAIDALRRGGEMIPDALLAHLAPVGWAILYLTNPAARARLTAFPMGCADDERSFRTVLH